MQEKCFKYWTQINTDCSVCIRVCPYNRPGNTWRDEVWRLLAGTPLRHLLLVLDERSDRGAKQKPAGWWGRGDDLEDADAALQASTRVSLPNLLKGMAATVLVATGLSARADLADAEASETKRFEQSGPKTGKKSAESAAAGRRPTVSAAAGLSAKGSGGKGADIVVGDGLTLEERRDLRAAQKKTQREAAVERAGEGGEEPAKTTTWSSMTKEERRAQRAARKAQREAAAPAARGE